MRPTTFQHAELRDENDEIIQQGTYGKGSALSNSTNDGWIDYVMNNLEALNNNATPLDSPAFTGTPTAPTPAVGDDSTKIATTEFVNDKADNYLPLNGGTLTGNVYTTPYYDSTIVDPEGGQTLIVSKGKVAKGTAPSNNEWHTMVMAVDNSGSTNNANKYGQIETGVKTDGSVETVLQTYKNEANSTTSAKISVGYDANGNVFTSAPTPTAGDNSTKIATTAFVNNYLPLSGGTMTGELNAPRLNIPFNFSKGTTPSKTQYATVYFSDKDGSDYGTNCIGLVESSVTTDNLSKTYMRALRNAAGSGASCEISVNVDNSGNGYTAAPTPSQTDDSTKIATTAYVKKCVPKSVGGQQRPVYTNSNGVITACTQTGDAGGLEGVSGKSGTYIRWESGYQICQGAESVNTSGKTVTYPKAFSSSPRIIVCAGGYTINAGFNSVSSTSVKLTSDSSSGATVYYIAIGYWK